MTRDDIKKTLDFAKVLVKEDLSKSEVDPHSKFLYALDLLKDCVTIIEDLSDQNDSVWEMLEEIKRSDVENHQAFLKKEIGRKILEMVQIVLTKPEEC